MTPAAKKIARVQVPSVQPATRLAPERDTEVPVNGEAQSGTAWHWGESGSLQCQQCGAPMASDEIFCGECGAVSKAAAHQFGRPRDTAIIERLEPDLETARETPLPAAKVPPRAPTPAPIVRSPRATARPPAAPREAAVQPPLAPPEPAAVQPPVTRRSRAAAQPPRPEAPFGEIDELEKTRIVARPAVGERFVLQFSTGESSTVHGTGLIGRNPVAEPGEYFDQLVRVIDPSRSVSKTHLEFGQEGGAFWVLDRFSGNGTVIKEPDSRPVRCLPERRYLVPRGTRVDIGEQFFVVS